MSNSCIVETNPYCKFIYKSRYARWNNELKRREEWPESIDRLCNFWKEKYDFFPDDELRDAIYHCDIMPSMRSLMTAGKALDRDHVAGYNCSFVAIDDPKAFDEILYVLSCGTGVGFSVERQHVQKLPVIAEQFFDTDTSIVVPDSKIGWASAFRELISLLYAGKIPTWDLHKIRPAGAILKTFGGRASGPGPLNELFEFTVRLFKNAAGRKLTTLEAHDLVCKVAEIIVTGGVRRCLPENTLVHTENGLVPMRDVKVGSRVLSQNGTFQTVEAKENVGIKNTVSIQTQMGSFVCTPEHRMAVLDDLDGGVVWKEAQYLTDSDFLVFSKTSIEGTRTTLPEWSYELPKHSTTCQDITIPELDADMAWFLGQLHGDGYVCLTNRETSDHNGYISIACADDVPGQHVKVVEQFKRFGLPVKDCFIADEACSKPRVSSHQLSLYLSQFKIANTTLDVPACVLEGTKQIRAAYVAGLFDADGGVNNRPFLVAASVYPDFLRQVQTVLASLGIISYIYLNRPAVGNWQDLFHLSIKGQTALEEFSSIVGPYSVKIAQNPIPVRTKEQSGWVVPKQLLRNDTRKREFEPSYSTLKGPNLSWRKFETTCGNRDFIPVRVEAVETSEPVLCFDLQVSETESFVAQGLLTHNSALISLSNLSDDRMRDAKSGAWWEVNVQRALANNSAAYTEKPEMGVFMREWKALYDSKSGERGIFNRNAAYNKSIKSRRLLEPDEDLGTNPCGEINLLSCEFCNLSEVIARYDDTLETLKRKVRQATIIGTFQSTLTDFRYLRAIWKKNCERERLLGVSITGAMDHPVLGYVTEEAERWLEELRELAISTNKEWADKLGITASVAITCNKPSGTVSQLTLCASGIHGWYSPFYIRTVRASKTDPLAQLMKECGVPCEDDVTNPNTAYVFSFPIKAPENTRIASDIPALEQLAIWKMYRDKWCEHNPSVTIYVKDHEWMEVGAWVYRNFDDVGGLSFLPYSDHVYKQAPYQPCSETTFNDARTSMPLIPWDSLNKYEVEDYTTGNRELACSAGQCSI